MAIPPCPLAGLFRAIEKHCQRAGKPSPLPHVADQGQRVVQWHPGYADFRKMAILRPAASRSAVSACPENADRRLMTHSNFRQRPTKELQPARFFFLRQLAAKRNRPETPLSGCNKKLGGLFRGLHNIFRAAQNAVRGAWQRRFYHIASCGRLTHMALFGRHPPTGWRTQHDGQKRKPRTR